MEAKPRNDRQATLDPESIQRDLAGLSQELQLRRTSADASLLHHEVGRLKAALGNTASAVRDYLTAYNHDPSMRAPLIELVNIFERRRSFKNLGRLFEAEAQSGVAAVDIASALVDQAVLLSDHLGEPQKARELLEQAREIDPTSRDVAVMLEYHLRTASLHDAALELVAQRAELTSDPVLATLLRVEVAREKDREGDTSTALEVLRKAADTPAARWRALDLLERIARRDGRHHDLVFALEQRAELAAAEAGGQSQVQASGLFSIRRYHDQAKAAAGAAALYREAARLRATHLADDPGALADYEAALRLAPDDHLLRFEAMLAAEGAAQSESALRFAEQLLEAGVDGPLGALLAFRQARALERRALETPEASGAGDAAPAKAGLERALAFDVRSVCAADALYLRRQQDGEWGQAFAWLEQRAYQAKGEAKASLLHEAAHLAAYDLGDPKAFHLYDQAASASSDAVPILREHYAAALHLDDPQQGKTCLVRLLAQPLSAHERSALLKDLYELHRRVLDDAAQARETLVRAIREPTAEWAPFVAQLHAAEHGDHALLADAHLALEAAAPDADTKSAHLCAAARAQLRMGDPKRAEATLRKALAQQAAHPYALALLEEVLRARGNAEELIELLRQSAERSNAPRMAETKLLLAGAAAEAAGNKAQAAQAYEEAADRDPTSLAPLLSLKRLAENQNDTELLLRALEGLSSLETAAGGAGRYTLALGEAYDLVHGQPLLAEAPLTSALSSAATPTSDDIGLHAALHLSLLPRPENASARRLGLARWVSQTEGPLSLSFLRVLAGEALGPEPDLAAAERALSTLGEHTGQDAWVHLAKQRASAQAGLADAALRAKRNETWTALSRVTLDENAAAELGLIAMYSRLLSEGAEAEDDALIEAYELAAAHPKSLPASAAVLETMEAFDDPGARVSAQSVWLSHAGNAGRASLETAYGRALCDQGRAREGLEVLLRVAASHPDDLASWEAARVAGRNAGAYRVVVEACDRLAQLVPDPELRATLWEESAQVLEDELGETERAERRLRRALSVSGTRSFAYRRLHRMLLRREDEGGLLELVSERLRTEDDPEHMVALYYEQARLFRSVGLGEEALSSLDNLMMLEPEHTGALALRVDLFVQFERFEEAVENLITLASCSATPDAQKRIARLGAADFAENRLHDPELALQQLHAIVQLGAADLQVHERMARLAEGLDELETATTCLDRALVEADAPATARIARWAGKLHHRRGDRGEARRAYQLALEADPTDGIAADALAELVDEVELRAVADDFERAVHLRLRDQPASEKLIRDLLRVARYRNDSGLETIVRSALRALGFDGDEGVVVALPNLVGTVGTGENDPASQHPIPDRDMALLRVGDDDYPVLPVAQMLADALAAVDKADLAGQQVSRSQILKGDAPLRKELVGLAQRFGVAGCEVFVGGTRGQAVDLLPSYRGRPAFIVGTGLQAPLPNAALLRAAQLAFAQRFGVLPFVRRNAAEAALALFGAAAAAGAPMPSAEGQAGMDEITRLMYKAMGRRVRKALPELMPPLEDGRRVTMWANAMHRACRRAGVFVVPDLEAALADVARPAGLLQPGTNGADDGAAKPSALPKRAANPKRAADPKRAAAPSEDVLDLIGFWLSPEVLGARRSLGWPA